MSRTVHAVPDEFKPSGTYRAAKRATRRAVNMHERLRKARLLRFPTSADAAAAFGFNPNTLRSNENGNKPFGRDMAVRYASAFGVRLEWLLSGRGTMRSDRRAVIVEGYVGAGAAVYPIDEGAFDPIEPPFGVPENAIAFVVRGDSMYPAYRDGTFVIVIPLSDPNDALYCRAVVTLEDGRRYIKDLSPGSSPGLFTLFGLNSAPVNDVRVVHAAKVIGTKEP